MVEIVKVVYYFCLQLVIQWKISLQKMEKLKLIYIKIWSQHLITALYKQ